MRAYQMDGFFDTELILRTLRKGMKIKEIHMSSTPMKDSKIRLSRDIIAMLSNLIKLRIKFLIKR